MSDDSFADSAVTATIGAEVNVSNDFSTFWNADWDIMRFIIQVTPSVQADVGKFASLKLKNFCLRLTS